MIADVALHRGHSADGQEQPHAHVMLTMRDLTGEGFGKKNRDWNAAERLEGWRAAWADHANRALERAGCDERLDHRSLKDQREAARSEEHTSEIQQLMHISYAVFYMTTKTYRQTHACPITHT